MLWLASLAAGGGIAHSQEFVDVHAAIQGPMTARPGSIVAAGIKVRNPGASTGSYKSRLDLPEGWRLVIRDLPFDLKPGSSDVRLISFSVPAEAPAKQYDIRYTLEDAAGHTESVVLNVVVPPVVQLHLVVERAPRYVVAGSTFSTKFLLTNNGNSATPIRLRSRSSSDFPITVDSTVLHFAPGEAREVNVNVATNTVSGRVSHTLELEAVSGLDSTIVVRASSVVEVVSRSTKPEEEYYNYPVTVRLREVGQDGLFATQAEASGSASLSEKHDDRLEFLLRGPETQTKSVLGQRDAYNVAYQSRSLDLYAGDLNYFLSTLTEFGRYATGAGGRATTGGFTVGGFYNYNRWSTQNQTEAAGYAAYNFSPNNSIGLNYLQKNDLFTSDIASLRGLFTPFGGSNLDLEYGSGTKEGKRDDGISVRWNGYRPWIGYDVRYVHAGPNFGGYYQDIDFLSASVNVQATRTLRVETYARQENRNLAHDSLQLYLPNDQYYQIGLSYSDNAALYYLHTAHLDKFKDPKYKRQEDAVQGRVGFNSRTANLYLSGDYGSTRDELLQESFPYKRIALNASFRPRENQNYSASLEYTNGQDIYTTLSQERFSASLNAWILLGHATQFQFDVYGSWLNASPNQTYALAEAFVDHVFPFGHKITLRARESIISTVTSVRETAYSLEYAVPFDIPIRRITAVGQLRGSVTDENGKGMANVLVNAGEDAALTNRSGEFYFASLKPGPVFVTIDQASIGLDRITSRPMPIEVNVTGGEEAHLDLGVTRSILVTGSVILFDTKEPSLGDTSTSTVDLGGRSGVLLELTNGKDFNRRVTDNRGRFSFADIRPGPWTLKITGGEIPEYHLIVPDSITIDAMPGDRKEVTFELRPKKRVIRMLQQGGLIQEVPTRPEKKAESLPPPTKPVEPCLISYDPARKGYVMQTSSWLTKKKARRVAGTAQKITGVKAFTVTVDIPKLGRHTRVFLGVFANRKAAEEVCTKLRANE